MKRSQFRGRVNRNLFSAYFITFYPRNAEEVANLFFIEKKKRTHAEGFWYPIPVSFFGKFCYHYISFSFFFDRRSQQKQSTLSMSFCAGEKANKINIRRN
uniref:Uncharacterized protein n=1 Tax=Lotharella oceanica TaxID=641309 RepID=A0A7S2XGZ0_9EUKA